VATDIEGDLRRALAEVRRLMADAFEQVGGAPVPGTALDQCDLRDGGEVVEDYLRHGEPGVAFKHMLYMIVEPPLPISGATHALIEGVGRALGMDPSMWQACRPPAGT
jgi:hypothetical protein